MERNRSEGPVGHVYPPHASDAICERTHYVCNPPPEGRPDNPAATVTITPNLVQKEGKADRFSRSKSQGLY